MMEQVELASVIIPTLNRPQFLGEAVRSALDQTWPELEIVVVDDGSDDHGEMNRAKLSEELGCPVSIGHWTTLGPGRKFKYVYQENQGIGGAVNTGLDLTSGEFIQRLDDDDIIYPEKIERSIEVFKRDDEIGMVVTGYNISYGNGILLPGKPQWSGTKDQLFKMLYCCISTQSAIMVRRKCHDELGYYRTDILDEDYEMWTRIARRYKIATINDILSEYRRHDSNITSVKCEQLQIDLVKFIDEYLNQIPLDELLPGLTVPEYGYLLRAAIYLTKDGKYVRTVPLAAREVARAMEINPHDPLVQLWRSFIELHAGKSPRFVPDSPLPEDLASLYERMENLEYQREKIKEKMSAAESNPMSKEMVNLRLEYSRLCSDLVRKTLREARR